MRSSSSSALEAALAERYMDIVHVASTVGAECYRATHEKTAEQVFIKIVNSVRFRREVNALQLTDRQQLVVPFDAFYQDGETAVVVYPWCPHGTLRGILQREKYIGVVHARKLAEDLLKGIESMHANRLSHCDIKPENIVIHLQSDGSYRFALTDFGSSATFGDLASRSWRGGSPAYEAPESVNGRSGPGCDLYSAGVVLFEAMKGCVPFQGMPHEIFRRAMTEFPSLAFIEDCRLRLLVCMLLQKDPGDRPNDAAAALTVLDQEKRGETFQVPARDCELIPGLSLVSPSPDVGDYTWTGCDEQGRYTAFGRLPRLSLYDDHGRWQGSVDWHGVAPVWHRSQIWYLLGADLLVWDVRSGRHAFFGALGFIPELIDVDDQNVAWIAHDHILLLARNEPTARPKTVKLSGYLKSSSLALSGDRLVVVSGTSDNDLLVFSCNLELIWRSTVDGVIFEARIDSSGWILVLYREFQRPGRWVVAAFGDAPQPVIVTLPQGILRATLSSIGVFVWTKCGSFLYWPAGTGFERREWHPKRSSEGVSEQPLVNF